MVQVLLYLWPSNYQKIARGFSVLTAGDPKQRESRNSVKLDRVSRKTTIYYGRPAASFQKGPDLCPAYLPLAGWTLAELNRDPKLAGWLRQSTSDLGDK